MLDKINPDIELFNDFYTGLPQRYKDELIFSDRTRTTETRYEHKLIDPDRIYHDGFGYLYRNLRVKYKNRSYVIGHGNDIYCLMYEVISDLLEEYGILLRGLEVLKRGGKHDEGG